MDHPFMAAMAAELARRGIATLRYQFPYMERGVRRPDPPQLAQATVRAAVAAALRLLPELPLIGGGKSFGGRMTSQTQAKAPLQGVYGLAFLGFPLHPAGQPSQNRAEHLFEVQIPMLFLQGTRDKLASLDQLEPLCKKLGKHATLKLFADADHSFHVPARTGRKDAQVLGDVLDALAAWLDNVVSRGPKFKKNLCNNGTTIIDKK
jgi:predicted alpha/beta-hydrolase family hydrolase